MVKVNRRIQVTDAPIMNLKEVVRGTKVIYKYPDAGSEQRRAASKVQLELDREYTVARVDDKYNKNALYLKEKPGTIFDARQFVEA